MRNIIKSGEWDELSGILGEITELTERILAVIEEGREEDITSEYERLNEIDSKVLREITSRRDDIDNLLEHETRSLGMIRAFSDKIRRKEGDATELSEQIKIHLWMLSARMKALAFWAEDQELEAETVDLNSVMEEGGKAFKLRFEHDMSGEKRELIITIEEGINVVAHIDTIMGLILNMVVNAKLHGKATEMRINIYKEEGECKIEIADNGKGIAKKIEDKIFTYGFTGEYGRGVGLGDAEDRLETMDGKIKVCGHGGIDGGAKFVITLQAA